MNKTASLPIPASNRLNDHPPHARMEVHDEIQSRPADQLDQGEKKSKKAISNAAAWKLMLMKKKLEK